MPDHPLLWDPEIAIDWLGRSETYIRLRARANSGPPAMTAQVYAEVLTLLHRRRLTEGQMSRYIAEIKEHFVLLHLTPDHAEAFAKVVDACRRSESDARGETWFAWQVALSRREGHRIIAKAPSRYVGLLTPSHLA